MHRHIIHNPRYLGENLRRLRQLRDRTVEQTAKAIGVSKGYISLIESGKRSPHWTVLMKIVHALEETLCSFFTMAEALPLPEEGIRSRRTDVIVVNGAAPDERGEMPQDSTDHYTHILTPHHPSLRAEVIELALPPHTEWTPDPISFPGHVTAWGNGGRLLLEQENAEYIMHQGECLSYDASQPHMLRNYTDNPTKALLVVSPVSF